MSKHREFKPLGQNSFFIIGGLFLILAMGASLMLAIGVSPWAVPVALANGGGAPVIDPIGDQTATEGVTKTFTVTASGGAAPLTLSATGLPVGATFVPGTGTGLFSWTPDSSQGSSIPYFVQFHVIDNTNVVGSPKDVKITVADAIVDLDMDGVPDSVDNCPDNPNPGQSDLGGYGGYGGGGNTCDSDPLGAQAFDDQSQVDHFADTSQPTSHPGDPVIITSIITFNPLDFNGDGKPDAYQIVPPTIFNVIPRLECKDTLGVLHPIDAKLIPEGFGFSIPNDLFFKPPLVSKQYRQDQDLSLWYDLDSLPLPINCQVRMTYVNELTDPELGPTGDCPAGTTCYPRIWLGEADAGTVNFARGTEGAGEARVWVGLFNSDDVGTKFDLRAEVSHGGTLAATGQVNGVVGGSSGFNNAKLDTIALGKIPGEDLHSGDAVTFELFVRNACFVKTHNSGTARLWFNDSVANSRLTVTVVGGATPTLYLLNMPTLSGAAGGGPRKTIDVPAGAPCSAFKLVGTWTGNIP